MSRRGVLSRLPSVLKIGALIYELLIVPKGTLKDCWGECNNHNQNITLERGRRRDRTINVVIHEVLHACWDTAGLPDRCSEERAVTALANSLQQIIRDNPKFRKWFREEVCKE